MKIHLRFLLEIFLEDSFRSCYRDVSQKLSCTFSQGFFGFFPEFLFRISAGIIAVISNEDFPGFSSLLFPGFLAVIFLRFFLKMLKGLFSQSTSRNP